MSRTDHHSPPHIRGHHAHLDGRRTEAQHAYTCIEYRDYFTGRRYHRTHEISRVEHAVAEANGWDLAPRWDDFNTATHGYYRVPIVFHDCDIDSAHGKCSRWVDDRDRMPYTGPVGKVNRRIYYRTPERAAVRASLRRALREARYGGDYNETVDEIVPTAQHRHAIYGGGWWD